MEHAKGGGRPPLLDTDGKRRLVGLALQHPFSSAKDIGRLAVSKGSPQVSTRTVQNYLHNSGIFKLVPKPVVALTDAQKQKRVDFCDAHILDNCLKTFLLTSQVSLHGTASLPALVRRGSKGNSYSKVSQKFHGLGWYIDNGSSHLGGLSRGP